MNVIIQNRIDASETSLALIGDILANLDKLRDELADDRGEAWKHGRE
jgi:hypothetical protein